MSVKNCERAGDLVDVDHDVETSKTSTSESTGAAFVRCGMGHGSVFLGVYFSSN